ncbi:MAG: hypothetical protein NT096_00675 [Proteobacteria bacterium]|nr:hypothetical protein [Pseudomonadota bacterium]
MTEDKKEWPKTVEEAVDRILSSMPEKAKERVKNTPRENLGRFHFSLGLSIRNNFHIWFNKDLLRSCRSLRPCGSEYMFGDEASMIIIEALWKKLNSNL